MTDSFKLRLALKYLQREGGKGNKKWYEIADMFDLYQDLDNKRRSDKIRKAFKSYQEGTISSKRINSDVIVSDEEYQQFVQWKRSNQRSFLEQEEDLPEPYEDGDISNMLLIGDIHEPFSKDGYLEFCREQQEKFKCGSVIFLGDIIDSYWESMHEKSIDGTFTAVDERNRALKKLKNWYYVFPEAKVCLGNHDLRAMRKAKAIGLSVEWLKDFSEVIQAPSSWEFAYEFEIDDVIYMHGTRGSAFIRSKNELVSIVQGHLHTEMGVRWIDARGGTIFGMQVGCGIDRETEAFHYAKDTQKKQILGCGVMLENGTIPITIKFNPNE